MIALARNPPLAELGPSSPKREFRAAIEAALPALSLPARAGLWLAYDFFDESHAISQELDTPEGSFWHAILHRREPDAGNAKYWFRRIGSHAVFDALREQAPALGYEYTTPIAFVDFCERNRGTGTVDEEIARRVQHLEWRLVIECCCG